MTINVTNVDEAGEVSLSAATPAVDRAFTATVSDPDGSVSGATWTWSWATTRNGSFTTISGANTATYTPVTADADRFLKATVSYTDSFGSGKSAERVSDNAVYLPQVTVMFARASYRVAEGRTAMVRVTLSADPQRTVVIPLTHTPQGATPNDYSGVPQRVTFNSGDTSKSFTFTATQDELDDDDESVLLGFDTSLPNGVSEGTPNEATVTIKQTQFELDCEATEAVWCSDLEFSDQTAENWGWNYLKYGRGWDPPASLSDDDFRFRGVDYTVLNMDLRPGTHPVMANAWSRWQQGYSSFSIRMLRGAPSKEHSRDWVLHLDGLKLAFKDALPYGDGFLWVGPEIQEIFNDWTPSAVNMIGIEEVAEGDQDTDPRRPWRPMQVDASPQGSDRLRIHWSKPSWTSPGLPAPTEYIVQWKLATESWDNGAAVSKQEVAARSAFHSLTIEGLSRNTLYSVRVIARNLAGDGPPSEETLGRPQDGGPQLLSQTVNGQTLTLRFSRQLDPDAVPAATNFVVMADGGLIAVDSVAIDDREVLLTLNRAVTAANNVLVRYDKPTDPSAVFLRDTNGNHAQVAQHLELLPAVNATPHATPQSSVQPLTAQFANVPDSHDGATNFTFDIKFSEPVWIGTGLARDHMLEVTGGTVISAPWKDRRSDEMTVHIRPDTGGDIVIFLPGNRVCAGIISSGYRLYNPVAGAPCAIGNRVLTNEPTETIPGPASSGRQVVERSSGRQVVEKSSGRQVVKNTPAEGELRIDGIPELGQTLSADTTAIADADGLENAVFQYQWLADDADIAGATGVTYTVESPDAGKAIKVRVAFTDDGGNDEQLTSAATGAVAAAVVEPPLTATVHGVPSSYNGQDAFTFELRFSEDPKPDFSYTTVRDHAFTVTGGSVTYVRRLERPGNIRWKITVTPDSSADVTIALNATTDCEANGAICTEDGRKLSAPLELTVNGPGQ